MIALRISVVHIKRHGAAMSALTLGSLLSQGRRWSLALQRGTSTPRHRGFIATALGYWIA
jgi:hypothetical protein